jgi:hypothetical protein
MVTSGDQQLNVGSEPLEGEWYPLTSQVLSFKEMNLSIHMSRHFGTQI